MATKTIITYKAEQIAENAMEIACDVIEEMQDVCDIPRGRLFTEYIYPWAAEAEEILSSDDKYEEYYDFITGFAKKKLEGFKKEINPLNN